MQGFVLLGAAIYALIGGPSVGKTSIIEELKKEGKTTVEEAATYLIKEKIAIGDYTPWEKEGFQQNIFDLQMQFEKEALATGTDSIFVDRGCLDNLVYLKINDREDTDEYRNLVEEIDAIEGPNRYTAIFFIEPYNQDAFSLSKSVIRRENTEESLYISSKIKEAYSEYYEIITIPGNLTPKQRARLVLTHIDRLNNS